MSRLPEWVWAPLTAALLTVVVGAAGLLAGLPWLFPSLGPTIFLQVHKPDLESARPWNVVIGHFAGIAGAAVGVLVSGAGSAPPVLSEDVLTWPRIWAAVIAMALTLAIQIPLKASHPPAAATALLVALGGFRLVPGDLLVLIAGILLTAALGEGARRMRRAE
jgi:hypothetical protein